MAVDDRIDVRTTLRDIKNAVGTNDPAIEFGEVSVPASTWTTVVSLTPTEDRIITAFGADLTALLSTNYRFRLTLDGATKWQEVASTTVKGEILARMKVPAGSTVTVDLFHSEAAATNANGSFSHESA